MSDVTSCESSHSLSLFQVRVGLSIVMLTVQYFPLEGTLGRNSNSLSLVRHYHLYHLSFRY